MMYQVIPTHFGQELEWEDKRVRFEDDQSGSTESLCRRDCALFSDNCAKISCRIEVSKGVYKSGYYVEVEEQ